MTQTGKPDIVNVYCSGPLFSPEERAAMTAIAATLEGAGYQTFLPHRDGLEPIALRLMKAPGAGSALAEPAGKLLRQAVFALDVFQLLERCGGLVINLNGRVPDEGAVVEAAIAFAAGKPLVAYKDDARTMLRGHDNPMVTGVTHTFATVASIAAIPAELAKVAADLHRHGDSPYCGAGIPSNMRRVVDRGRKIWRIVRGLPSLPLEEPGADELLRQLLR